MSDEQRMSKYERVEIAKVIRARERVAISSADRHAAELKAEFERQLCAQYPQNHPAWAEVTDEANERIAEQCEKLGIRKEFAPSLNVYWMSRGENAFKERRAELRKAFDAMIAEQKATAIHEIKAKSVELQEQVVTNGLTSDAAKAFLERLPTPEQLMPPVSLKDVEDRSRLKSEQRRLSAIRLGSDD
jgi:hypothetical protein